jgi:hypothetical protein
MHMAPGAFRYLTSLQARMGYPNTIVARQQRQRNERKSDDVGVAGMHFDGLNERGNALQIPNEVTVILCTRHSAGTRNAHLLHTAIPACTAFIHVCFGAQAPGHLYHSWPPWTPCSLGGSRTNRGAQALLTAGAYSRPSHGAACRRLTIQGKVAEGPR